MIELKPQVAGRFKIEAMRPDGTRRELAPWQDNLVLDAGLERMGNGAVMSACQVGSGSTTPSVLNTALASYVAGTTTVQTSTATAATSTPYYQSAVKTFRFAAGVATGNLTEVGIGWSASTGSLFARALIKDGGGSPTTITVLSDEVLDVIYEVRLYPTETDSSFSVTISGVSYSCVARAAGVTAAIPGGSFIVGAVSYNPSLGYVAYSGSIGAITSYPSGTSSSATPSVAAYSATSLQRDITLSWGLTVGNVGGIGAVMIGTTIGTYQVSFSPVIPKDATKTLALTFRVSWARRP